MSVYTLDEIPSATLRPSTQAFLKYKQKVNARLIQLNNAMSTMVCESFSGIDDICNKVRECLQDAEKPISLKSSPLSETSSEYEIEELNANEPDKPFKLEPFYTENTSPTEILQNQIISNTELDLAFDQCVDELQNQIETLASTELELQPDPPIIEATLSPPSESYSEDLTELINIQKTETSETGLVPLIPDVYRKRGTADLHDKLLQQIEANDSFLTFQKMMRRCKVDVPIKAVRQLPKTSSTRLVLARKYTDSLWFSQNGVKMQKKKSKSRLRQRSCTSLKVKPKIYNASEKIKSGAVKVKVKECSSCTVKVEKILRQSASSQCRMKWIKMHLAQKQGHNRRKLEFRDILDDLTNQDLQPFQAEYPRKDYFGTGEKCVTDSYLYHLTYQKSNAMKSAWKNLLEPTANVAEKAKKDEIAAEKSDIKRIIPYIIDPETQCFQPDVTVMIVQVLYDNNKINSKFASRPVKEAKPIPETSRQTNLDTTQKKPKKTHTIQLHGMPQLSSPSTSATKHKIDSNRKLWTNKYAKTTAQKLVTFVENQELVEEPHPKISSNRSLLRKLQTSQKIVSKLPNAKGPVHTPVLNHVQSLKARNDMIQNNLKKAISVIETKMIDLLSAPGDSSSAEAFDAMEKEITDVLSLMQKKEEIKISQRSEFETLSNDVNCISNDLFQRLQNILESNSSTSELTRSEASGKMRKKRRVKRSKTKSLRQSIDETSADEPTSLPKSINSGISGVEPIVEVVTSESIHVIEDEPILIEQEEEEGMAVVEKVVEETQTSTTPSDSYLYNKIVQTENDCESDRPSLDAPIISSEYLTADDKFSPRFFNFQLNDFNMNMADQLDRVLADVENVYNELENDFPTEEEEEPLTITEPKTHEDTSVASSQFYTPFMATLRQVRNYPAEAEQVKISSVEKSPSCYNILNFLDTLTDVNETGVNAKSNHSVQMTYFARLVHYPLVVEQARIMNWVNYFCSPLMKEENTENVVPSENSSVSSKTKIVKKVSFRFDVTPTKDSEESLPKKDSLEFLNLFKDAIKETSNLKLSPKISVKEHKQLRSEIKKKCKVIKEKYGLEDRKYAVFLQSLYAIVFILMFTAFNVNISCPSI